MKLIRLDNDLKKDFIQFLENRAKPSPGPDKYIDQTSEKINIYVEESDFFKYLTYSLLDIEKYYFINQKVDLNQFAKDYIDFLDTDVDDLFIEHADELSDYDYYNPKLIIDVYKNSVPVIFNQKDKTRVEFNEIVLRRIVGDFSFDSSSITKLEKSITDLYKNIASMYLNNVIYRLLKLDHFAFLFCYDVIKKSQKNSHKCISFLGKIHFISFDCNSIDPFSYCFEEDFPKYLEALELINLEDFREQSRLEDMYVNLFNISEYYERYNTTYTRFPLAINPYIKSNDKNTYIRFYHLMCNFADKNFDFFINSYRSFGVKMNYYFELLLLKKLIQNKMSTKNEDKQFKEYYNKLKARFDWIKYDIINDSVNEILEYISDTFINSNEITLTDNDLNDIKKIVLVLGLIIDNLNLLDSDNMEIYSRLQDYGYQLDLLLKNIPNGDNYFGIFDYSSILQDYLNNIYVSNFSFEYSNALIQLYNQVEEEDRAEQAKQDINEFRRSFTERDYATLVRTKILGVFNLTFNGRVDNKIMLKYLTALEGTSEFIKLYSTSEFNYNLLMNGEFDLKDFELTPIITGLLKGTEQMLSSFVEWYYNTLEKDTTTSIRSFNIELSIRDSEWKQNITFGSLVKHIDAHIMDKIFKNCFEPNKRYQVINELNVWNTKIRNSKFHSSNIYNKSLIDPIINDCYHVANTIIQLMRIADSN